MRPVPADAVRESTREPWLTWRWYDPIAAALGIISGALFPLDVTVWVLIAAFALVVGSRVIWWWRERSASTRAN